MTTLGNMLDINKCPHCKVDKPNLTSIHQVATNNYSNNYERAWRFYLCARCGGIVTAAAKGYNGDLIEIYPSSTAIDASVPDLARKYLEQAANSLHAPAGAVMLSASAVDAMLKAKGYKEGSLYSRINKAVEDHLITEEMARWAHDVRLDANDQRHADETVILPEESDARKSVDFALALAEFLFVLPAHVKRGLADAEQHK